MKIILEINQNLDLKIDVEPKLTYTMALGMLHQATMNVEEAYKREVAKALRKNKKVAI